MSKEGPDVYRMVLSAWRWIRESPAARATSLMYTEKRVGPRIEPCGTPIDTARGPENRPLDLSLFDFLQGLSLHINQRFSCRFGQPANFQSQSLGRLLKTITI